MHTRRIVPHDPPAHPAVGASEPTFAVFLAMFSPLIYRATRWSHDAEAVRPVQPGQARPREDVEPHQ